MQEYRATVSAKGELNVMPVLANDIDAARTIASREGRVLRVKKVSVLAQMFQSHLAPNDRILLLQRFALLVKSRQSVTNSLRYIEQASSGATKRVCHNIRTKVSMGGELKDALESLRGDFPDYTTALIKSGMRSGNLHEALYDAATFEQDMQRVKQNSKIGLYAAVFNFLFGAVLILGTHYGFAPYFLESSFMQAGSGDLNIGWVKNTGTAASITVGVFLTAMISLFLLQALKPFIPSLADKIILKIPVYRDLSLNQSQFVVFYTLAKLVEADVRLREAFEISTESAPRGEIKEDFKRALYAIDKGRSDWVLYMKNLEPTDYAALQTAQNRQHIAEAVGAVARMKKDVLEARLKMITPILSFVGYLLLALGGFLLFAYTTIPTLQLMQNLG